MNTHIVSKSFALSKYRNLLGARKSHEKKEKKKKKEHLGLAEHNLYLRGNKVLQSPVLHRFKYLPKFWILRHKVGIFQSGTIPRASGRCTPRQRHGHSTGATLEQ